MVESYLLLVTVTRWDCASSRSPACGHGRVPRRSQVRQDGPVSVRTRPRTVLRHPEEKHCAVQQLRIVVRLVECNGTPVAPWGLLIVHRFDAYWARETWKTQLSLSVEGEVGFVVGCWKVMSFLTLSSRFYVKLSTRCHFLALMCWEPVYVGTLM